MFVTAGLEKKSKSLGTFMIEIWDSKNDIAKN